MTTTAAVSFNVLPDCIELVDNLLHRQGPETKRNGDTPVFRRKASFNTMKGNCAKLYNQHLKD
jgi:hypothetical protein